jgi:DNA (cytosine-5)-methyltransferase 1
MPLTMAGLFSGVGGFELAAQRAGLEVLWMCEFEPYCQQVLQARFPGVPVYGDVRELRGADVVRPDVLCGGFPCQDVSKLGERAGLGGERSGLWREFARLVREVGPRYVLVENVAALLSPTKDGPAPIAGVLGDLAALGFDALWDVRSACSVGAAHLRERVFILAYPGGSGLERHWPQRAVGNRPRWTATPRVCRGVDGVPHRVDRTIAGGNAIVPDVAEQVFRWLAEADRDHGSNCDAG